MTYAMSLNNAGFTELTQDEMIEVDGGSIWGAVAGAVVRAATVTGSACGLGPVGGGVVLAACVVAVGVGIYVGYTSK